MSKWLDRTLLVGPYLALATNEKDYLRLVKDAKVEQATRNISELKVTQAKYLNVYDVLNADTIVITKDALEMVHEWLGGTK